jgi:predicted enzyme related to lactoylglutathione lyase
MKVTVSWFSTTDFEATKKFYSDVLGLEEVFGAPGWAEFAGGKGETTIGLAANPRAGKEPGATIVLQVAEIETERRRLEAHGVKFEGKSRAKPSADRTWYKSRLRRAS